MICLWEADVFQPAVSNARAQSGGRFLLHTQVMYGWKTSEEFLGAGILPEEMKERVPCNLERGRAQMCSALAPVSTVRERDTRDERMLTYLLVANRKPSPDVPGIFQPRR
jgi:hypothetical protein